MQAESSPQGQGEVNFAEVADSFDAQAADIDLGPLGALLVLRGVVVGGSCGGLIVCGGVLECELLLVGWLRAIEEVREILPAMAMFALEAGEFAEIGDHAMARAAFGAHGLDQTPVLVGLAVLRAPVSLQKHTQRCGPKGPTATDWSRLHGHFVPSVLPGSMEQGATEFFGPEKTHFPHASVGLGLATSD